jgi:hypothetical protein
MSKSKPFSHVEFYILWRALTLAGKSLDNYVAPRAVKRLAEKVELLMRESSRR